MLIHTGFERAILGKGQTGAQQLQWGSQSPYNFARSGKSISDEGNNPFTYILDDVDLKTVAQISIKELFEGAIFVIEYIEIITKTITGAAGMPTVQFGLDNDEDSILAPVQLGAGMNVVYAREHWDAAALAADVAVGTVGNDPIEFGVTIAGTSTTHTGIVIIRGQELLVI